MVRRIGSNSFAVDRTDLTDSSVTTPPAPPLRDILAPVPDLPPETSKAASKAPAAPQEVAPAQRVSTPTEEPERAARGVGGRPEGAKDGTSSTRPITVRIPAALYETTAHLVKGVGLPSWGQLIAWTCEDYRGQVLIEIGATTAGSRSVRGHNRAGAATSQISPSFTSEERQLMEDIKAETGANWTAIMAAALVVARRQAA